MIRNRIWTWATDKQPLGVVLPWWLLTIRALLYPLDFFYWRMSKTRGYQWESDTWLIEGVRYSGKAMRVFAKAQGELYRIRCTGDTVWLERIRDSEKDG